MNMINNLFKYATSELSQDAFICWLCSFALQDADKSDNELVTCASNLITEFVRMGLDKENIGINEVGLCNVERQCDKIDVLLTAKYDNTEYKIIVEDKTHTSEHDNQLQTYRDNLENKGFNVIGIYFKTGFQSNYSKVEEAKYKVFDRAKILKFLESCNSNNDIFKSYKEYWENFERFTQSYKIIPFREWSDWQQVNGFYDDLAGKLRANSYWADYDYVANKSGGFWGLWYGPDDDAIMRDGFKGVLYPQIEIKWDDSASKYNCRICTKLADHTDYKNQSDNQLKEKNEKRILDLRQKLFDDQEKHHYRKPGRTRMGAHMTIGEYNFDADEMNYEELESIVFGALEDYKRLLNEVDKIFER